VSPWWLVPLGLGSVAAAVARLATRRLHREHEELLAASIAVRALTETIAAAGPPPGPG
jgi:hypothetical protein